MRDWFRMWTVGGFGFILYTEIKLDKVTIIIYHLTKID